MAETIPARYGTPHLLLIRTITQVHVGVGRIGGVVDLPVQRDEFGFPCIYASSLKGTIKSSSSDEVKKCFGGEIGRTTMEGKVAILDASLVLMPTRSLHGVFTYVTSPLLIARFLERAELAGVAERWGTLKGALESELPVVLGEPDQIVENERIVLVEEIVYESPNVMRDNPFGEVLRPERPVVVVPDDDMSTIVERTLIRLARVRLEINEKKVATGGLWTEEYVPQWTLFSTLLFPKQNSDCGQKVIGEIRERRYYIVGGKESVGKGLIEVIEGGALHGGGGEGGY